jgi:hypothetical protein
MFKSRSIEKQISLRADALRFFDWCRFGFHKRVKKLSPADQEEYESGRIPKNLFDTVRNEWANHLKHDWPPEGTCAVAAKVLKTPDDLEAWNNCLYGQEHILPRRIRTAVFNALKKRGLEIHDSFFDNQGDTRLLNYLRVLQSQERALTKQIIQTWGYKCKKGGGASVGSQEIDVERMMLSEVEATGSALKAIGLPTFLRSLWEDNKTIVVKTPKGIEERIIPNPSKSEVRLNRFLIKLGRALASKKKRRELPDWLHGVDQTERWIVQGWCESIMMDNENWPPLCLLTTPALGQFLKLCNVTYCKLGRKDARTIERAVQRLGLVRLSHGRIKYVDRRGGKFHFS